jgi:tRNA pseudouridine38-40 synthase
MVERLPDVERMNEAAKSLLTETDFASFCKAGSDNKTTICDVTRAEWVMEGDVLIFHITADRFLRNMVRAIVGSLYEVGRGKWSVDEFKTRIAQKKQRRYGNKCPRTRLIPNTSNLQQPLACLK